MIDVCYYCILVYLVQGLLNTVIEVLLEVEHRWCERHIFVNWLNKWHGGELKKKFWMCAWSTFPEEFKNNLEKLGELSKKAAEDLLKYPAHN